jgi:dipeptidyl aminopeptidase/acylaminoacyl peptidase
MPRTVAPYGSWPSPFGVPLVASAGGRTLAGARLDPEGVWWCEGRADEGGRIVLMRARRGREPVDVTPAPFNVRTRVHEYGGGACWFDGETIFFSSFDDSRLYRQDGPDALPRPLTSEPAALHALRYADGRVTQDGRTIVCVRERHEPDGVVNELVILPADGSGEPRTVVSGADFYAAPRPSPDGRRLAWLEWNHPQMPFDGTELWVADLGRDGDVSAARRVAGGPTESILQPEWSPSGMLHFSSDSTGWWNLYAVDDGDVRAVAPVDGDVGAPMWVFGTTRYAFLGDGRIVRVVTRRAVDSLELVDPETGRVEPLDLPWTAYSSTSLDAMDTRIAFTAFSPHEPGSLVVLDIESGHREVVTRTLDLELDADAISAPREIEFPTTDGAVAHAFYYPPTSATHAGPADERPPLRVICHGGPTAHTSPQLDVGIQFYTSRGIGVADVNYRGSTGYGREYREALKGRWGDADVADCVAVARFLAERGEVDGSRAWIEGGSAGGYVVLCALCFHPGAFAAGVSRYGVADAEALALDTHKFESRYLDSLVGPYPEQADLYRDRSPIHHTEQLDTPLLLLQGLDDKVVPPSQAELMVAVLDRKRVPYAYIAFEGEGHGFRRTESLRRMLEATLSFVGQVFGFEPADDLEPVAVAHLD